MKKVLAMIMALAMVFALCACGAKTEAPAAAPTPAVEAAPAATADPTAEEIALAEARANPITLKCAIKASATAANAVATQMWADLVNEADVGIEMLVYPDAQLGSETEVVQQILMGEPLIINADPTHLESYAPQIALLNGPYFVEQLSDFDYVIQTQWFKDQVALLDGQGLHIVNADMHFGQRHVLATKAVRTPADLAGLKIRSQPSEVSMATVEAMGGTPTPLAFSEIFEALNNGVVEGEENPLNTIYNAKHHETPAKIISLTGHTSTLTMYTMNTNVFNSLTDLQKKVIEDTAHEAFTYYNDVLYVQATDDSIAAFANEGVTIVDDVDIAAFKEATKVVYTLIDKDGVYDEVMAQINALKK